MGEIELLQSLPTVARRLKSRATQTKSPYGDWRFSPGRRTWFELAATSVAGLDFAGAMMGEMKGNMAVNQWGTMGQ